MARLVLGKAESTEDGTIIRQAFVENVISLTGESPSSNPRVSSMRLTEFTVVPLSKLQDTVSGSTQEDRKLSQHD